MVELTYELVEPVGTFEEGTVLDVTARFGDWHVSDVKLEPHSGERAGSVELTWDRLRDASEVAYPSAQEAV